MKPLVRSLVVVGCTTAVACGPPRRDAKVDASSSETDTAVAPDDDPCSIQLLGHSYIGCEYYATVTLNDISDDFHFAVVISNPGPGIAHVVIDGGGLAAPRLVDVADSGVEVIELPWVAALEGCASTDHPCGYPVAGSRDPVIQGALATAGAYHITSSRPVTAYQFNPLEFEVAGVTSHSNDASLLFPVNAMGDRFVVAAHEAWPNGPYFYPGFLSITATANATSVTITTTAPTPAAAAGVPALAPGVPTTVTLERGDVLQVQNYEGDLTGTLVQASAPIQLIGGHYCTTLPFTAGFCDHMEENHPGIASLGRHYVSTAPAFPPRTDITSPVRNIRYLRVVATVAGTHVAFDPPNSAAGILAQPGDVIEVPHSDEDLVVHASEPVLVAEYMVSSTAPTPATMIGDPSMALAVPLEQYRRDYRFHAPPSYDRNYVNIVAKTGTSVTLDGNTVGSFTPIGAGDYSVARLLLGPGSDGDHHAVSAEPFGISVYGYAFASSYWYPGGLDLEPGPLL